MKHYGKNYYFLIGLKLVLENDLQYKINNMIIKSGVRHEMETSSFLFGPS